jgi:hypothetical protein
MSDVTCLPPIQRRQRGFRERVLIQVKADHGAGSVLLQRQLIHFQGIQRKYVPMRLIPRRGTRSAIPRPAEIGHALDGALDGRAAVRFTGIGGQRLQGMLRLRPVTVRRQAVCVYPFTAWPAQNNLRYGR